MRNSLKLRIFFGTALLIAGLSIMTWQIIGGVSQADIENDKSSSSVAEKTKESQDNNSHSGNEKTESSLSSTETNVDAVPADTLNAELLNLTPDIQRAYLFAAKKENQAVLEAQTCYCGCESTGEHGSLLDCFIDKSLPGNLVVYEEHGQYCGTCLKEAWDVELLWSQGKTVEEIKAAIDSKYGR